MILQVKTISGRGVIRAFMGLFLWTSVILAADASYATILRPGDILVADINAFSQPSHSPPNGGIVRIDPVTGAQTTVSSLGDFASPTWIALDRNGDLLVTDFDLNAIFRVNPVTGSQTLVSSGGLLQDPEQLMIDDSGDIIVASIFQGIIRVNAITGAQSIISSGNHLSLPRGVAIDHNGDIIVVEEENRAIIRVDPLT